MCKEYIREKELRKWTNKLRLYGVLHRTVPHNGCVKCPNCCPAEDKWGKFMLMMNEKENKLEVIKGEDWASGRRMCGYHCVEWIMWF